jgi:hypothetical protein
MTAVFIALLTVIILVFLAILRPFSRMITNFTLCAGFFFSSLIHCLILLLDSDIIELLFYIGVAVMLSLYTLGFFVNICSKGTYRNEVTPTRKIRV